MRNSDDTDKSRTPSAKKPKTGKVERTCSAAAVSSVQYIQILAQALMFILMQKEVLLLEIVKQSV